MKSISKILFLALGFLSVSCMKEKTAETSDSRYQPKEFVEVKHPDWSKNATIYEANIRQFTPEGTFQSL